MAKSFNCDHKKVKYTLRDNGSFIIENYNFSKPFSSFFPGIAGLFGVPMWIFYVNRGQGICSFGTNTKDQPIMEFLPANKAYQMVGNRGFRTFIKVKDKNEISFYEPFQDSLHNLKYKRKNRMQIRFFDLNLQEDNESLGLSSNVEYFMVPSDNFAALARTLSITNNSDRPRTLELIDGLPIIIPYGLSDMFLKQLGRTIEAWMGVENLSEKVPFYRLRMEPTDRPEVVHVKKGNFYLSFFPEKNKTQMVSPIVDSECIFGRLNDLSFPHEFLKHNNFTYPKQQITQSKTPAALSFLSVNIAPKQTFTLYSLLGNMDHIEKLQKNTKRIASVDYINEKRKENEHIIKSILSNTTTVSSCNNFDLYCQGTFLDNLLRGGLPITLDKHKAEVVYVYSRKHGDLERDYNKFVTQPSYFSHGDGNYRDINQNRRNDIFFNPELKDSNVISFFNFIQLDGFNPLVLKGARYLIKEEAVISRILRKHVQEPGHKNLKELLSTPFHVGQLFMFLEEHSIGLKSDRSIFIKDVLEHSIKQANAAHKGMHDHQGYWSDHWTYNLDLLESFLSVYPEKLRELLLDKKEFTFYDDFWVVNPRQKKYVLYAGSPKQLNSVALCEEKQALIQERESEPHKVRVQLGKGEIYKTNLLEKCVCIVVNKLASLDPFGVGIEMETNKPNWYDALNGLPALFGSSISETMELKRLIVFLQSSLSNLKLSAEYKISLAEEIFKFYKGLSSLLKAHKDTGFSDVFSFWDRSHSLKEEYIQSTVFGLSGVEKNITFSQLEDFLKLVLRKLEKSIAKAYNSDKTYSTYFINEVTEHKRIAEENDTVFIQPLKFKQKPLPLFLEGFVHALRIEDDSQKRKLLHEAVRRSPLFDKALGMYKVNASLDGQPKEIGRASAFTPGWLENESIWLHMEYKYLLELLKSGLHDEFYGDFFKALIPFQDPQRYGRSILENSSFLVSSVFLDEKVHGNGFVARLSGSTSEFVHIWLLMNMGKEPFYINQRGELNLRFRPILHKDLFTTKRVKLDFNGSQVSIDKHSYAFNFLGNTLIVYHNPKRFNTYGKNAVKIEKIVLEDRRGLKQEIKSGVISGDCANDIRCGNYFRIDVFLS